MSTELYLKHIALDQLEVLQQQGLAGTLDDLYEQLSEDPDSWLLLDEHILGFMYFQDPEPPVLERAVMGGTAFADSAEREDYPRFFGPDDVRAVAEALDAVSDQALATRFEETRDVFGGLSVGGTDAQAQARLQSRFQEVRAHYRTAAQQGNAMLLLLY